MQNPKIVENLLVKEECYTVIGMCIRIHNKLGKGFKEVVYKDAMEVEFKKAGILYKREKRFNIEYEGVSLPHKFDADFLVFDSIILDVKASWQFHPDNFKQTLNYLKASQIKLGILINFGEDKLNFKRIVCSY
jgi:GxxExxY protein